MEECSVWSFMRNNDMIVILFNDRMTETQQPALEIDG